MPHILLISGASCSLSATNIFNSVSPLVNSVAKILLSSQIFSPTCFQFIVLQPYWLSNEEIVFLKPFFLGQPLDFTNSCKTTVHCCAAFSLYSVFQQYTEEAGVVVLGPFIRASFSKHCVTGMRAVLVVFPLSAPSRLLSELGTRAVSWTENTGFACMLYMLRIFTRSPNISARRGALHHSCFRKKETDLPTVPMRDSS